MTVSGIQAHVGAYIDTLKQPGCRHKLKRQKSSNYNIKIHKNILK